MAAQPRAPGGKHDEDGGDRVGPLAARRSARGTGGHARSRHFAAGPGRQRPAHRGADRPAARRRARRLGSVAGDRARTHAGPAGAAAGPHQCRRRAAREPGRRGSRHPRDRERHRHEPRPPAAHHPRGAGAGPAGAGLPSHRHRRCARIHRGRPLPAEVRRHPALRRAAAVRHHRQRGGIPHQGVPRVVLPAHVRRPAGPGADQRLVLHHLHRSGGHARFHGRHAAGHRPQRERPQERGEPAGGNARRGHRPHAHPAPGAHPGDGADQRAAQHGRARRQPGAGTLVRRARHGRAGLPRRGRRGCGPDRHAARPADARPADRCRQDRARGMELVARPAHPHQPAAPLRLLARPLRQPGGGPPEDDGRAGDAGGRAGIAAGRHLPRNRARHRAA